MTPGELFFHQAGSREGLIDTAIKTAETGSIYRELVQSMGEAKTAYDGSVRNSTGIVFQFVYGTDGLSAQELISVKTKSR